MSAHDYSYRGSRENSRSLTNFLKFMLVSSAGFSPIGLDTPYP